MNFYRHTWYYFGGVLFVALTYAMGFCGHQHLGPLRVVLVYSWMGMLAHQFEEYALPGGLPGIANIAMAKNGEASDRYPLNANQVMISNVFLCYTFYILAIAFPQLIWLGLAQVGQGMIQIINHGVVANVRMKTFYNPGMATVLLLQWPVGLYYIHFVQAHGLAKTADYWGGLAAAFASIFVLWLGPIIVLRNRNSKYPFTEAEMFKFIGRPAT